MPVIATRWLIFLISLELIGIPPLHSAVSILLIISFFWAV